MFKKEKQPRKNQLNTKARLLKDRVFVLHKQIHGLQKLVASLLR